MGGWLVATAAGLVAAGGLVGLLVWDRRLFLLAVGWMCSLWWAYRIPNRNLLAELEAAQMRLSAYNASDSRADLAEAPLTPPGGTTEVDPAPPSWMDQSGYRPPRTLATGHDDEWVDISDSVQSIEITPGRIEHLGQACAYGIRTDEDCGQPADRWVLVGGYEWWLCARHYVEVIERGETDIDPCETCKGTGNVCDVHGRGICLDCDEHDRSLTGCPTCTPVRERCGDISPVTGAACQHPPGHTIRHVGPLGEGTYRERWGDFPDLDASDGPRSLPNGRID